MASSRALGRQRNVHSWLSVGNRLDDGGRSVRAVRRWIGQIDVNTTRPDSRTASCRPSVARPPYIHRSAVRPFVHPPTHPSVHPTNQHSIRSSLHPSPSTRPPVHPTANSSIHTTPSVLAPVHQSIHPSIHPSGHSSVNPAVHPSDGRMWMRHISSQALPSGGHLRGPGPTGPSGSLDFREHGFGTSPSTLIFYHSMGRYFIPWDAVKEHLLNMSVHRWRIAWLCASLSELPVFAMCSDNSDFSTHRPFQTHISSPLWLSTKRTLLREDNSLQQCELRSKSHH
ncbi:unnamed protein product [Protopolystoma xenopodis]|uniref:Uncharacterized protein n=1 Tax=Protopolystoma xenopodis TaxID=117903 RepID=A0A3S5AUB2_9PLAT|nr:unnamed protein product [Protopolystoma xenopodis]